MDDLKKRLRLIKAEDKAKEKLLAHPGLVFLSLMKGGLNHDEARLVNLHGEDALAQYQAALRLESEYMQAKNAREAA
jgi:hypothetical protein